MTSQPGSKYYPLHRHLQRSGADELELALNEIESILDATLPQSAYEQRAFWSNRARGGHQARAWLAAGYRVKVIDLEAGTITFVRSRARYTVAREEGSLRWDAAAIRALREHMELNQEELAQLLGVRQQTISEWENEVYRPTRSSSKHLTLVAERADFPYQVEDPEADA